MTSTSTCCDYSGAPTRYFIHENDRGCAECRVHGYARRSPRATRGCCHGCPRGPTGRPGAMALAAWGDQIVGGTGDGALRGPGEPDATDDDRQRPLPAVPPAVISGLTPGGFVVHRGMRACPRLADVACASR